MTEYLTLHIANLFEHRWVRKVLAWNPSIHLFDADLWKGLAPCARIMPPIYRTPNGTTTRCHRVTAGQPLVGRCLGRRTRPRTRFGRPIETVICNANIRFIQPKEIFGRVEHNNDADRCAEKHVWDPSVTGGVRVEVGLAVVVSLRPRGVACGQASSIQRDRIMIHIFAASPLSLAIIKFIGYELFDLHWA